MRPTSWAERIAENIENDCPPPTSVASDKAMPQHVQAMLDAELAQANLRIADLAGKLSVTGDNVNQSSAAMQVKIKELGGEVDKLWASAWRKNDGRLTELESGMKKAAASYVTQQKQLTTATADISSLKEQVGQATTVAATVDTLKQQQAALQAGGRMASLNQWLPQQQASQQHGCRLQFAEGDQDLGHALQQVASRLHLGRMAVVDEVAGVYQHVGLRVAMLSHVVEQCLHAAQVVIATDVGVAEVDDLHGVGTGWV